MARSRTLIGLIAGALLFGAVSAAQASAIVVVVDKSAQELTVSVDGAPRYSWPVSTARMGYRTPNGTYRPQRLERMWHSRIYDWSPMPYSIFFNGGYAIHGTYETRSLGAPASHGCIRLAPANAAVLFSLVKANLGETRIVVTGEGVERAPRRAVPQRLRRAPRQENFEDVFGAPRRSYNDDDAPQYWRWR
jgi:lipoprotein-anchoring transpeptidase ErfK/SrfK